MHRRPRTAPAPIGALLLAGAVAFGALAGNAAHAQELEGARWKVVAAERAGKPIPAELDAILSFQGGTLKIRSPEGASAEFAYVLDRGQHPAHVDLSRGEGDKRVTLHGIWKLEGDRFTLCVSAPFGDRPTEFATAVGAKTSLTVHERIPE